MCIRDRDRLPPTESNVPSARRTAPPQKKSNGVPSAARCVSGWKKFAPAGAPGSHSTLVQMPLAMLPKSGLCARTWLLPEPEKNITFPVRSSAAWMASTWESNGNNSQDCLLYTSDAADDLTRVDL